MPVHAPPIAVDGTAYWFSAGVSAVRAALTELYVLAKSPSCAYAEAVHAKPPPAAPYRSSEEKSSRVRFCSYGVPLLRNSSKEWTVSTASTFGPTGWRQRAVSQLCRLEAGMSIDPAVGGETVR